MEPLRHGVVVNWDAFESAWTAAVQQQLKCVLHSVGFTSVCSFMSVLLVPTTYTYVCDSLSALDGCSLVVTGTGCTRVEDRLQICELVFEVFGASSLLINAPGAHPHPFFCVSYRMCWLRL